MINIAVDAMGGDDAPGVVVRGAVNALESRNGFSITLVGKKELIEEELSGETYLKERLSIAEASEVIEMAEPPVAAIRHKKDSSIVVGLNLVKHNEADAFVSAGSTGAVLAGGQLIVGKEKGVKRAPLAPLIPTERGAALLIDCGANVDARADHLLQFAYMGSIYMRDICGVEKPRVAIVNIGAEEEKGNALVKEAYPMLKEAGEKGDIYFVGSIEARDIPKGEADVVVCEAFVGNVILKLYEGVSSTLLDVVKTSIMSTARSKIGGALIKPALKDAMKRFDVSSYGGAPLLGLKNLVVKGHGSSTEVEIKNAILQCFSFIQKDITSKIRESISPEGDREGDITNGI